MTDDGWRLVNDIQLQHRKNNVVAKRHLVLVLVLVVLMMMIIVHIYMISYEKGEKKREHGTWNLELGTWKSGKCEQHFVERTQHVV